MARSTVRRPDRVMTASVVRPSVGCRWRSTNPCVSSRSTALVMLVGWTWRRTPSLPERELTVPREREQPQQLEAREREVEPGELLVDPRQQHLLGPHDRRDRGHARRGVVPAVLHPLAPRFGDRIHRHKLRRSVSDCRGSSPTWCRCPGTSWSSSCRAPPCSRSCRHSRTGSCSTAPAQSSRPGTPPDR